PHRRARAAVRRQVEAISRDEVLTLLGYDVLDRMNDIASGLFARARRVSRVDSIPTLVVEAVTDRTGGNGVDERITATGRCSPVVSQSSST
ncbi:MAG: hypothetical protein M3Z96_10920, partial [Pseudomonadota bacterium]|nr:hypothetical protein [Pseudomonadota bacterium]